MFQRITAFIIFLVLIFGTWGYYGLLKYEQFSIKEEVAQRLKKAVPKEKLSKIIVTKNNEHLIDWERKGKEFRYNNKMYDVVFTEHQNGNTIYYCLNDKEETTVLSKLDNLVKNQIANNNQSEKKDKSAAKIFFSINYFPIESNTQYSFNEIALKNGTQLLSYYSSGFFNRHSPPPKQTA